jgi:DNA-binding transcriptional regulator YhcF (GntR family)
MEAPLPLMLGIQQSRSGARPAAALAQVGTVMSIAVCKWAWKVCTYPSAKLVLLCLAEHSDNHGNCWPSLHRIKSMTGLGYTTVNRCLSHLEDNGLVDRKRGKGGKGHSTHYRLAVGNGAKQLRDEIVQQSQEETVSERNSPAVSVKQSHSEQQTVPLRDTNHKEPPLTKKGLRGFVWVNSD